MDNSSENKEILNNFNNTVDAPPPLIRTNSEDLEYHVKELTNFQSRLTTRITHRGMKFNQRTLFCFQHDNPLKVKCVEIALHPFFENFILFIILCNCITLAMDNEINNPGVSVYKLVLNILDAIWLSIFTIEMIIKCIAFGFWSAGDHSYFRDPWNRLDMFIVLTGYLYFFPQLKNITAIRTCRALRAMKLINSSESIRRMVGSLVNSLFALFHVLILFIFLLVAFGLVGMQFYSGRFRLKCFDLSDGIMSPFDDRVCSQDPSFGRQCPSDQFCADSLINPSNGLISFDNIGVSLLTLIQAGSLSGWTDIMYMTWDNASRLHEIYWIAITVIISHLIISLVVAVILDRFEKNKKKAEVHHKKLKEKVETITVTKPNPPQSQSPPQSIELQGHLINQIPQNTQNDSKESIDINEDIPRTPSPSSNLISDYPSERKISINETPTINKTEFEPEEEEILPTTNPRCLKIQNTCQMIGDNKYFQILVMIVIIYNTLLLAAIHSTMSDTFRTVIRYQNIIIVVLFSIEIAIKIGGGLVYYNNDHFNWFDTFIIVLSYIELIVFNSASVNSLRALRILKLLKTLEILSTLHNLLEAIFNVFSDMMVFSLVLFLFLFVYAIMGMQLYQGRLDFEPRYDRAHFDNFIQSFVGVFQIVTGENWNFLMADCKNAFGPISATIFCTTCFIGGNYIILNLFLALLLGNFEEQNKIIKLKLKQQKMNASAEIAPYPSTNAQPSSDNLDETTDSKSNDNIEPQTVTDDEESSASFCDSLCSSLCFICDYCSCCRSRMSINPSIPSPKSNDSTISSDVDSNTEEKVGDDLPQFQKKSLGRRRRSSWLRLIDLKKTTYQPVDDIFPTQMAMHRAQGLIGDHDKKMKKDIKNEKSLNFSSLYSFPPRHPFRIQCYILLHNIYFQYFMYFTVLLHCVILALWQPDLDESTILFKFMVYMDIILSVILLIEVIIKTIAYGFILHPKSFCRRNFINVTDIILVIIGLADASSFYSLLRQLRFYRSIRFLRLIDFFSTTRMIAKTMIKVIPNMINVMFIALLFFLIFGIIGMFFFQNRFKRCEDINSGEILFISEEECTSEIGLWRNPRSGDFDHLGSAILVLYEISTLEGWTTTLWNAIDSNKNGAPIIDHNPRYFPYFIVYIFLSNIFVLGLFVGVVVMQYENIYEIYSGSAGLTEVQRLWLDTRQAILTELPTMPKLAPQPSDDITESSISNFWYRTRCFFFSIVTNPIFDNIIMVLIILNTLVLCLYVNDQDVEFSNILDIINYVFTWIFVFEMIFKWLGLGIKQYFQSKWNRFDFFLVLGTVIAFFLGVVIFPGATVYYGRINPKIMRVFRILRIFRLLNKNQHLKKIVKTLIFALPSLIRVLYVLLVVTSLYACGGVLFFSQTKHGEALNDYANFDNFHNAIITLVRMSTGENWNDIMHDCMIRPPFCIETDTFNNCGSKSGGVAFFVSWSMVSTYLVLNIFVAVVIKHFQEGEDSLSSQSSPVHKEDIRNFYEKCCKYSVNKYELPICHLESLLSEIGMPLGPAKSILKNKPRMVLSFAKELNIPQYNGCVHYTDLCTCLAYRRFRTIFPEHDNLDSIPHKNEKLQNVNLHIYRLFPQLKNHQTFSFAGHHIMYAISIQKSWRNYVIYKKKEKEMEQKEMEQKEHKTPVFSSSLPQDQLIFDEPDQSIDIQLPGST